MSNFEEKEDKTVEIIQREEKPNCFLANGVLICRCGTCAIQDFGIEIMSKHKQYVF